MKNAICFVDDDKSELQRFEKYLKKDFKIGIGISPKDSLNSLNEKGISKPDLWILDMYFPEDKETSEEGKKEINEEWHKLLEARKVFKQVLTKYSQSAHGGLELANNLKKNYNHSNFIFFTRKGMIDDAIRGLKAGALQILKKPDYNDDDFKKANGDPILANDLAFEKRSAEISNDIFESIKKLTFWYRNKKLILGLITGFVVGVLASMASQL